VRMAESTPIASPPGALEALDAGTRLETLTSRVITLFNCCATQARGYVNVPARDRERTRNLEIFAPEGARTLD
jgi:hypothetical protein